MQATHVLSIILNGLQTHMWQHLHSLLTFTFITDNIGVLMIPKLSAQLVVTTHV